MTTKPVVHEVQRPTGWTHDLVAPMCCHAIVLIHGINDDGKGWFNGFGKMLREESDIQAIPRCQLVFGFTWRVRTQGASDVQHAVTPGIDEDVGRTWTRETQDAGLRFARTLREVRNMIGTSGRLVVVAHSHGTVVLALALAEQIRIDCAILLASPIVFGANDADIKRIHGVPLVVNCASISDHALAARRLAALGAEPIGEIGLHRDNKMNQPPPPNIFAFPPNISNSEKAKWIEDHRSSAEAAFAAAADEWLSRERVPSLTSTSTGIFDVIINRFDHADWHDPSKFPPKLSKLLKQVTAPQGHSRPHSYVQPESVMGLRGLADELPFVPGKLMELHEVAVPIWFRPPLL